MPVCIVGVRAPVAFWLFEFSVTAEPTFTRNSSKLRWRAQLIDTGHEPNTQHLPTVDNPISTRQRKFKVFLSYSRRDAVAFADQLAAALETCGYEPIIDRHGIA